MKLTVFSSDGTSSREQDFDGLPTFEGDKGLQAVKEVVVAINANNRQGTHSTKTRGEVRGGGKKPWRQKGTGRARAGSSRSPIWTGGGVALGPKPRKYDQKTPKKMVALALKGALSDRASEGKVIVIDQWNFEKPSTKAAKAALAALGVTDQSVLLVLGDDDEAAFLSFRNLPEVQCMIAGELNTYDVLNNDWIVFTQQTLPSAPAEAVAAPAAAPEASTPEAEEGVAE